MMTNKIAKELQPYFFRSFSIVVSFLLQTTSIPRSIDTLYSLLPVNETIAFQYLNECRKFCRDRLIPILAHSFHHK